jgi:hypothetical protein
MTPMPTHRSLSRLILVADRRAGSPPEPAPVRRYGPARLDVNARTPVRAAGFSHLRRVYD